MNFPEVIEYTYDGEKYRAEYDGEHDNPNNCFYMVYQWEPLGFWFIYCHHTYKGIQELITKEKQMDVTTLKQQLEAAQQEITKLQQALEESENNVWPKKGDEYWYTSSLGSYAADTFSESNVDAMRIAIGNCYKTQEAAKQVVEKMKVMTELKRLADKSWKEAGVEIDWSTSNSSTKYFVRCGMECDIVLVDNNYSIKNINDIYFHSEQKAKEAIDKIGEDRLKSVFKQN